ncbi:PAS domain S-box protein [Winogradskyella bathintestinalis]|uniref:histidine kinase n=1 Tax=Winogradskyella bathintestinalis TaxID=3035208 RepID=A0ABT7ZW93_9FLAO|nr:PAS domain S-box protein [Winogradskyella bathintestinalis]MDN3493237.1 PAS domain S-box protein [Winogradskyella bathintestinalis]
MQFLKIDDGSLYKGIFETSVEGILVADKSGVIVKLNAAAEKIFGYDTDELLGEKIEVLIPKELKQKHVGHRNRYSKKPEVRRMGQGMDLSGVRKDGSLFPLEISLSPSVIDGNPIVVAYVIDITKRLEVEKNLKNSEAKNKAIIQALPDYIFVVNKERVYTDVHSSNSEILKKIESLLVGNSIFEMLPEGMTKKVKAIFDKVEKTGKNETLEYTFLVENKLRHYEGRVVLTDQDKFLVVVRDTSEQKEAEKNLFIKNRALDSAANGIIIVDATLPKHPIIYVNDAFSNITGYSKDDAIGKNWGFLQGSDSDQKAVRDIKRAMSIGHSCNVQLRNYKKDGSLFWNEVTITPVFDANEKLTHFIGVQNDVTTRKKEELLKENSNTILEMVAKHQSIETISNKIIETTEEQIDNALVSILRLNTKEKTLHKLSAPKVPEGFNTAIEGIKIGPSVGSCGTAAYTKKEVIVADIENDPLWKDHKKMALKNGLKACWSFPILSSKKIVLGTFAVYCETCREPTSEEKNVLTDATKLLSIALEQEQMYITIQNNQDELKSYADQLEKKVKERTNELSETVAQLIDVNDNLGVQIEETKLAELKALSSQSLYLAIAQQFPNGVIVIFDKHYKILSVHGEDLKRLGLDEKWMMNKTVDEIPNFTEERRERLKADLNETLNGNHKSFQVEFGEYDYAVNSLPLYNGLETAEQALFVYTNITEQKDIEKKIHKSLQKEKDLGELKSRFISMASHEFRTPLSVILSSATLIEKLNAAGQEEKRENYVKRIKSNVKHLVTILNDFLSLGKIEEGKLTTSPQELDIVIFSKNIIEDLEFNLKEGQAIQFSTDKDEIMAFLDEKLLRHIILNLMSNAIKYSNENKQIILELKTNKSQFTIEVTDDGIGIPEDEQANLFDRFFRAQNVTNIQGTGLGLHIVKRYVEILGGSIAFKSEPNQGSTFTVILPLKQSTNEETFTY